MTQGQPGRLVDPRLGPVQAKPEEVVGPECEQVRVGTDGWEAGPPEQLDRLHPLEPRQVELDRLGVARQIGDDEDRPLAERSEEGEDLRILVGNELEPTRDSSGIPSRKLSTRLTHHHIEFGLSRCTSTLTVS